MAFIRDYYAHDADMLLFFERRQLQRLGESRDALREHVRNTRIRGLGEVDLLERRYRGRRETMAYVAANFRSAKSTNARGEPVDRFRPGERGLRASVTANGSWCTAIRPFKPRRVRSGSVPSPHGAGSAMETRRSRGCGSSEGGAMLIATASLTSRPERRFRTPTGGHVPDRRAKGMWLTPEGGNRPTAHLVEVARLDRPPSSPFVFPGGR